MCVYVWVGEDGVGDAAGTCLKGPPSPPSHSPSLPSSHVRLFIAHTRTHEPPTHPPTHPARRSDRRHAKYELVHVVRTHMGQDDSHFGCVKVKEDATGKVGISLSKVREGGWVNGKLLLL